MIEYIKDRYLTWRTGHDKSTRTWLKWQEENIVLQASTIENMFMHFKHIVPVSIEIFDLSEPFAWIPCKDFEQYMYPQRALGDNAVYHFARGYKDRWDGRFHLNDICHYQDQVFVATNNEVDAVMIALKYS